jgi:aerobic-type carbon monoxide dehydrogenase small subunit (CoxS/CutS family)
MRIEFTLNGKPVFAEIAPGMRLLDLLRETFELTGTKEGCGEGECGACSVLINGELANSCLVPAFQADGATIETIELISQTEFGKRIVSAFCESGAVQCGFCTPGFIVSTYALLKTNLSPTDEQIKISLSGNLCRCTGYAKIIEGVKRAMNL